MTNCGVKTDVTFTYNQHQPQGRYRLAELGRWLAVPRKPTGPGMITIVVGRTPRKRISTHHNLRSWPGLLSLTVSALGLGCTSGSYELTTSAASMEATVTTAAT